jgi:integrase/recombinase XerC
MDAQPTLPTLVAQYLLRCSVEGKSPRTVRAYRETLGRFLTAVPLTDPAAVGSEQLYAYLGGFTHLTLESRHRYFREVRCFFNWLVAAEYLERSPFRGMRNVRLPQRIVQPFSADELARLVAACSADSPIGIRDQAMVLTLLDTGVRCSELVQLQLEDLDLADGRLRVLHGKGNKQRVVPFAGRCRDALHPYIAARGDLPGPLFLAATGHGELRQDVALQPNGLKQMLRRLERTTGIPKVHAHRFRHTFATWAIQHDARELDVQYLLGHSSPDMVRRYSSSYGSEQAALRHHRFSPGDQMIGDVK